MVKHIYVSPHSDDVALSCGGQILANADRASDILVLNIFTSDKDASGPGSGSGDRKFQGSVSDCRQAEDQSAWASAGVRAEYANLPEALLRQKFPFAIIPARHEDSITDAVYDVVMACLGKYPEAIFHFPAGFGNHVDHLACRQVAFRLLDENAVAKIMLYEDIPYSWLKFIRRQHYKVLLQRLQINGESAGKAFRQDGVDAVGYLAGKDVPFPRGKKLFILIYLTRLLYDMLHRKSDTAKRYRGDIAIGNLQGADLSRKQNLLHEYRSQIPMLFGKQPETTLRMYQGSFAQEVTLEITKI